MLPFTGVGWVSCVIAVLVAATSGQQSGQSPPGAVVFGGRFQHFSSADGAGGPSGSGASGLQECTADTGQPHDVAVDVDPNAVQCHEVSSGIWWSIWYDTGSPEICYGCFRTTQVACLNECNTDSCNAGFAASDFCDIEHIDAVDVGGTGCGCTRNATCRETNFSGSSGAMRLTCTMHSTANPTANPTMHPTANPTLPPTANPTANPTSNPTANPTVTPTANPTAGPTTSVPTSSPTANPTGLMCPNVTGNQACGTWCLQHGNIGGHSFTAVSGQCACGSTLSAGTVGHVGHACTGRASGAVASPNTSPQGPPGRLSSGSREKLSATDDVGIGIGAVAFIAIVAIVLCFFKKGCCFKGSDDDQDEIFLMGKWQTVA